MSLACRSTPYGQSKFGYSAAMYLTSQFMPVQRILKKESTSRKRSQKERRFIRTETAPRLESETTTRFEKPSFRRLLGKEIFRCFGRSLRAPPRFLHFLCFYDVSVRFMICVDEFTVAQGSIRDLVAAIIWTIQR
jgi:hypothetical protein